MNTSKTQRLRAHCPRCRHQQIFVQTEINHLMNLVLVVVTAGLWLISWLALCIGRVLRPWRCEHCGWHKPEFRDHPKQAADPAKQTNPAKAVKPVEALQPAGKRAGALRQVAAWIYP